MRVLRVLFLILLPTALYLAWLVYLRYRAKTTGSTDIPALREGPWFWLLAAGIVLAIASLVSTVFLQERIPSGQYVPPRLEDGRVAPAQRAP